MTNRHKAHDKEFNMSRIVKIVTASVALVAAIAISSPAVAAGAETAGGTGCCTTAN